MKVRLAAWARLVLVLLLCLWASISAEGALTIHLRFSDGTLTRQVGPGDVGNDFLVQVWGRVDDVGGTNGTGSRYGLQFATYSIGTAAAGGGVGGGAAGPQLIAPWNALGSQVGTLANLPIGGSADGIMDLGSLSDVSTVDFAKPRASTGVFNDSVSGQTQNTLANGVEFLLEVLNFHVTSANPGSSTRLDVLIPSWNAAGTPPGANWWQKANSAAKPDGINNGDYLAGTSVTLIAAVPEPSTLCLAGLSLVGGALLVLRRKAS